MKKSQLKQVIKEEFQKQKMELTLKPKKRNLQPIYDDLVASYKNGNIEDMKTIAREFVQELISKKEIKFKFNETINKIQSKDRLLQFITNIHMQDSQETAN